MAKSFRLMRAMIVLALGCVFAWPAFASAAGEQPQSGSALEQSAVPAATLPGGLTTGNATPQAYIKNRVELRIFRGTVVAVHAKAAQIVVAISVRSLGRTVRRRQAFSISGARLRVTDENGDGSTSVADIQRGDRVRVRAAVSRGTRKSSVALPAREVLDRGPVVSEHRRGRKLGSK